MGTASIHENGLRHVIENHYHTEIYDARGMASCADGRHVERRRVNAWTKTAATRVVFTMQTAR